MKKLYFLFFYAFLSPDQIYAQTELAGTWQGKFEGDYMTSEVIWKFLAQSYELDLDSDGSIEVSGKWETDGKRLFLWDVGGPMACPETERGEYTFELIDNSLKLTLVEDNCPGRKMMGPTIDWNRKE